MAREGNSEMMIRGNSPARGLTVEGARVVALRGRKLRPMMDDAERERDRKTIFIFGVPDLMQRNELYRWREADRGQLIMSLERARGRKNWFPTTIFPPSGSSRAFSCYFGE